MSFIELVDGRPILLLNGFPYYKKETTKNGVRWCCNKSYCNAFVHTSSDCNQIIRTEVNMSLIELVDGRPILLLKGFPYYKKKTTKKGVRWCCNKTYCNAFVHTLSDFKQIIRTFIFADYKTIHITEVDTRFIELIDGKQILLLNGFPFYKKTTTTKGVRWNCNKSYCKAFVQLSLDFSCIIRSLCDHDHSPTKYIQSAVCGKYIRLR
ncbi:Uncharacterized protein OBRU01_15539 [Operophtera brumata]|uniref:FLYWCH-type domain-containing protein n=1 Tax=Operophtera brumata TaxID=104452 RepID=A0A0L7L497_OPEBR|nr:Uncharacterized protein OBRU01_15539 [Operophtera brumata]